MIAEVKQPSHSTAERISGGRLFVSATQIERMSDTDVLIRAQGLVSRHFDRLRPVYPWIRIQGCHGVIY